jgi:hypothetical protein
MPEITLADIYAEQLEQRTLLAELLPLVQKLVTLAERSPAVQSQPVERADDLVTVEWIAELFKCSRRSVLEGKAGTKGIALVGGRTKLARRGEVMRVYRAYIAGPRPSQARKIKLLNRQPRS